jgi:hypothetical protein
VYKEERKGSSCWKDDGRWSHGQQRRSEREEERKGKEDGEKDGWMEEKEEEKSATNKTTRWRRRRKKNVHGKRKPSMKTRRAEGGDRLGVGSGVEGRGKGQTQGRRNTRLGGH